ncbi:aminoglycoside phosphotransferase family protein [Skeletonema marinoi]|uniref:Aminoglycoside phosphotransferase family protein n=1 Tax=Skeletonema marinoi TaxID=267567 RepID=A0AAD8YEW6_9STRA|nr:aminoglycoside phosphotransferase family protein [Skeletonema marinoi]
MPLRIDSVRTPDDISVDILSEILNEEVIEYRISPLGRGVLSNVQTLDVTLSTRTVQFIAKFRKDEIPLEDLFNVEGAFYHLVDELEEVNAFPFRLPKALATGSHWLLLEYISENVTTLDVYQSCPMNQFDDLIHRLAKMHEYCWVDSSNSTKMAEILNNYSAKLADAPGAGHTLPSSARQEQFAAAWPAVKKRLVPFFSSESLQSIDDIVKWIAASERIELIKNCVEEKRYTLVHGDFHMGNMLLPTEIEGDVDRRSWLVDWSFSGIGNPSVDLVFFMAMNDITAQDTERVLQEYFSVVKERSQLSWNDFLTMFRQCLLNQFIILVCYDSLCRTMADSSSDERMVEVQHAHFDRVNTRCAQMILLYNYNDGNILPIA